MTRQKNKTIKKKNYKKIELCRYSISCWYQ